MCVCVYALLACLNDDIITMTLNRRPMRPLPNRSNQMPVSTAQVCRRYKTCRNVGTFGY